MKTSPLSNALRTAVALGLAALAGSARAVTNGSGGLDGWFHWLVWLWM